MYSRVMTSARPPRPDPSSRWGHTAAAPIPLGKTLAWFSAWAIGEEKKGVLNYSGVLACSWYEASFFTVFSRYFHCVHNVLLLLQLVQYALVCLADTTYMCNN